MYEEMIPTTELEAVNALLEHLGESPVSSLEDLAQDAASAHNTLRRVSREVQARGWHWNRTIQKLVRNSNQEFLIPRNAIRVDTIGPSWSVDVVIRGRKLFDKRPYKNTTRFEEPELHVEVLSLLDYEDLPEAVRQYVYIRAARQFQEFNLGSTSVSQFSQDDESFALAVLIDEELETGDYNLNTTNQISLSRIPVGRRI